MPLIGTFGAGSAKGFGLTSGGGVPFDVQYLVVAGGGSGGLQAAGGAGAGGYRLNTGETSGGQSSSEAALELITGEEYSIVIGAGGVSAPPGPSYPITTPPTPGTDSTFADITSTAGGTAGGYDGGTTSPDVFGQGGSGAANSPGTLFPGIAGQGSAGGNFIHTGPGYAGGGGGGAGGAGNNGGANGGTGGVGLESDITGSNVFRAGGGGGGSRPGASGGSGGNGGGGAGTTSSPSFATPGTVNTGGGGGGEGYSQGGHGGGGSGGSGFVAIKVPDSITATFSAGVTSSLNTGVSGYRIYSVTATSTGSETVTFAKG